MKLSLLRIITRSVTHNIRGYLYQFIIIVLLTGVVTGSLMTGKSVRESLKQTSFEKLGNAGIVLSSGIRYFNQSLVERMSAETGATSAGLLELDGYCQSFATQKIAPQVKIFAVDHDFFPFHNIEGINLSQGEVAINKRLAEWLEVSEGDELIIRFNSITDIPADAPFSPGKVSNPSVVLKIGKILLPGEAGNFSLGISQMIPMNIFINRSDIINAEGETPDINRLIFSSAAGLTPEAVHKALSRILKPEDAGLTLRPVPATGGFELVTGRIFIDQLQVDQVREKIKSAFPAITYLANNISSKAGSTPYSFISALDPSLYEGIPEGDIIVINEWLAQDLSAEEGDTLSISWYSPDPMNRLTGEKQDFIVGKVVAMNDIWSDSLLMPEFPGIAGSLSCTEWDAGVEIDTRLIRDKDEDYWNRFGGTPKAFIGYEKGRELWAGNFGPATSIRFGNELSEGDIREKLTGSLDPEKAGFSISDLRKESVAAASNSVDFSTLFLGLGFFIIVSALILLILVISTHYESKKAEVMTFYSLGFTRRRIEMQLFLETGLIAFAGALAGAFAGGFFNLIIIKALNSVWQGAVQTNTLAAKFDLLSFLTGFFTTMALVLVILKINSSRYLKKLSEAETGKVEKASAKLNLMVLIITAVIAVLTLTMSFILDEHATLLSYISGILVFAACILLIRQYYLRPVKQSEKILRRSSHISNAYYSFHPSQAITPVVFLAAGIFAIMVTGLNRLAISGQTLEKSGGTGGYLLWNTVTVPVMYDLNGDAGRSEFALNETGLEELEFVNAKLLPGNDASCLNLNNVTSPPLIGINPDKFIERGSFSFASVMRNLQADNPWTSLNSPGDNNTIYGIADQTVLQWGLKIKTGDTLIVRSENGEPLKIVIAAGLKSSIFQGNVIIGFDNFNKYFPSISGSQILLVDGNPQMIDLYKEVMIDRFSSHGIQTEETVVRMSSFFKVTNTYLTVFSILGGIGLIMGVAGLGFVLLLNYNQRKRDFAFMLASGFNISSIRKLISREQVRILISGLVAGVPAAFIATMPSLGSASGVPWKVLIINVILIFITGLSSLTIAVRSINQESLIKNLRRE